MVARRLLGLTRDLLLVAGALLGVATIGWFAYSHVTGATLVTVQTGSMTPTAPQGALLVAQPIPVADVRVGDVVTTRLDDASPLVTHRVVRIDEGKEGTELTLKGDANDTEDVFPYRVDRVLRTVHVVPEGGRVLDGLRSPAGAVGVAVAVGGLVGWVLWASRESEPTEVTA